MNKFLTKKFVVYTLAIIASLVAVVMLFTSTLSIVPEEEKQTQGNYEQNRIERENKKSVINNFNQDDQKVEFNGEVYSRPQKVYTEEEKIKILNSF